MIYIFHIPTSLWVKAIVDGDIQLTANLEEINPDLTFTRENSLSAYSLINTFKRRQDFSIKTVGRLKATLPDSVK